MKTHTPQKRFWMTITALCAVVIIIGISAAALSLSAKAESNKGESKHAPDAPAIHRGLLHRAINEELSFIEPGESRYLATTLKATVGTPDDEVTYIGIINTTTGGTYDAEITLINTGGIWVALPAIFTSTGDAL